MIFRLQPMTAKDAADICSWHYPPPYARYRWPSWDHMVKQRKEFADPDIRLSQYMSVRRQDGLLAGYIQIFPLDRAVRIGLGLRPELCGIGLGRHVVRLAVEEAGRRRPGAEIDLEVETWNVRAIKAYEKAGFTADDEYEKQAAHGTVRLLCMIWRPAKPEADTDGSAGITEAPPS